MDARTTAALDALEKCAAAALKRSELDGFEVWTDRDDRGAFAGSITLRIRDITPADSEADSVKAPKPSRRKLLGVRGA